MTSKLRRISIACILLIISQSVTAQYYHPSVQDWEKATPQQQKAPMQSVFLIGDAGAPAKEGTDPVFAMLKSQMDAAGKKGAVVFLGDNIYPKGLPDTSSNFEYQDARRRLVAQLDVIKDYRGKAFVIPGNHDWAQGAKTGWERALNQQDFVEEYLDSESVFQPQDGCPGPVEISLNDEVTLVLLNTQWWLHKWEKPEPGTACDIEDEEDFLLSVLDVIHRNADKKVIVAGHHPLYTNGHHGGRFSVKDHLFPLTAVVRGAYLPLPVLGSIHPLYRGGLGNIQDVAHPRYQDLRKGLMAALSSYPNVIYAAGHEHNLQYLVKDSVHLVVSGSGSKETYFGRGGKARFGYAKKGFARVDFYSDGAVWLSYWVPDGSTDGRLVFRNHLFTKPKIKREPPVYETSNLNFQDSTVVTHASDQYVAGKGKRKWWGNNYRDVWQTDISVPVFDIGKERGGLEIVQRGGGQQTKSLRLEAANGRQYVLRSVEKYAAGAIPEAFRGTFAGALVQDQISTSNPFSAYAIAPLAEAAGVYHTNPELVYIPDDPRLGEYLPDFANTLALYEERPDDNREDVASFGSSKDIVNTDKVLKELRKDNDNLVDQQFVLRSRLFDTFLGDWDRHDDQWRWASFKVKGGDMFRPIPRDRDQAFFFADGIIPWIYSRKWALRKFQPFKPTVRDMPGLGFNARFFDRSFLTEPSWVDWKNMVDTLQAALTDEVIEQSIRGAWPQAVFDKKGEYTINTLKARRDNLPDFARRLYLYLSQKVSIVGSKKRELIEVDRLPDGETEVRMYKLSKKGNQEQLMYDRLFKPDETSEIRIYARGGEDEIKIRGEVDEAIKLRIIGGEGEDRITDESKVMGAIKTTRIYDTKVGNFIDFGTEARDKTSNREEVNEYDRKDFKYNATAPALFVGYNADDGVFLGGGTTITTHGFRKAPFATQQTIVANYAIKTGAVGMRYDGTYTDVLGKADVGVDFDLALPAYVRNFFGLGNETIFEGEAREELYNFVNYRRARLETSLNFAVGNYAEFKLAPVFHYQRVVESRNEGRFIADTALNTLNAISNARLYDNFYFLGGETSFRYDDRNDASYPTRGLFFEVKAAHYLGMRSYVEDYSRVSGNLAFYFTLNPLATTVASRIGGAHNFGEFVFFNANVLDLIQNMRGYRRNRFAGRSAAYWNTELRTRLFHFKNYVAPMDVGLLLVNDYGRVWQDGENSDVWHHGLGGGIWIKPYDALVLSLVNVWSDEGSAIAFNMGFMF